MAVHQANFGLPYIPELGIFCKGVESGTNTIILPRNSFHVVGQPHDLSDTPPMILGRLTIEGQNSTVAADCTIKKAPLESVFSIMGGDLVLKNLNIAGAIVNSLHGNLTLIKTVVKGNSLNCEDDYTIPSGISFLGGSLTVEDSTIEDTTRGLFYWGNPEHGITITRSKFVRNKNGGLSIRYPASGVIKDSAFLDNANDGGWGGGIEVDFNALQSDSNLLVINNTISRNKATFGGGISIFATSHVKKSVLNLSNNTISNNTVAYEGGGLFVFNAWHDGVVTQQCNNISGNTTTNQDPKYQPYKDVYIDLEGAVVTDNSGCNKVKACEFINPVTSNRDRPVDSDDFYLREPGETIDLYYRILPFGANVTDAKISVQNALGREMHSIPLLKQSGDNQYVLWDRKDSQGKLLNQVDYYFTLQVKLDGTPCGAADVHTVTDLVHKHSPIIRLHSNEPVSGPVSVFSMLDHARLKKNDAVSAYLDTVLAEKPVELSNLVKYNNKVNYLDLDDNWRRPMAKGLPAGTQLVYYLTNTSLPDYIFIQYWFFMPSSLSPVISGIQEHVHEGDWEMLQVTLKANEETQTFEPFAATASQHYYGQTLWWKDESDGGTYCANQASFEKWSNNNRPVIYLARGSHATYFKSGKIKVPDKETSNNTNIQYQCVDSFTDVHDRTNKGKGTRYKYSLQSLKEDPIVMNWAGLWGEPDDNYYDDLIYNGGSRSPFFRGTGKNERADSFIYIARCPARFHNKYLKDEQASELRIPIEGCN